MVEIELSSSRDLDKVINAGIVLLDFNAPWCAPCRAQEPIVQELEKAFSGRIGFVTVDIDKSREIALNLGIQSIPTIILFRNGKEVNRFVGLQSAEALTRALGHASSARSH